MLTDKKHLTPLSPTNIPSELRKLRQWMLHPRAAAVVAALDSYTEYSVSGTGLHVIVRARLNAGRRLGPLEIYPSGAVFLLHEPRLRGASTDPRGARGYRPADGRDKYSLKTRYAPNGGGH